MLLRLSEWVLAAYFAWTTILALVLPLASHIRVRTILVNAAVLAAYAIVLRMRDQEWTNYVRDWCALALMILAYKQMGWFAPASHSYTLEQQWIVWDRAVLDGMHVRALIESTGPVLPSILEICYAFVYALPPITMGILYATGQRDRSDALLTIYLLGLFFSYAQFPFWPSEPPRTVFAGQDLPRVHTVFRDFNLWLVGSYGIHTSVFPSAHVSGAFAGFGAIAYLLPHRRLVKFAYLTYAVLVATATVYGRYHYAVDAAAGALLGFIALPVGLWLLARYYSGRTMSRCGDSARAFSSRAR